MSNRIAIIPARSGSKRIPKKNIRDFFGSPVIAYPIQCAIECNLFDEIIVSTDSEEIAEIAIRYGAKIPFLRSPELADDYTGTDDVIKDALLKLLDLGISADEVCCIYPATPLLTANDLIESHKLLDEKIILAMAAVKYSSPILRALKFSEAEGVVPFFPQWINSRSQDLEDAWYDAGQFYWAKSEYYLNTSLACPSRIKLYPMKKNQVQDIDNEEDWLMAEYLYMMRKKGV